jgi:hypothetical protein
LFVPCRRRDDSGEGKGGGGGGFTRSRICGRKGGKIFRGRNVLLRRNVGKKRGRNRTTEDVKSWRLIRRRLFRELKVDINN